MCPAKVVWKCVSMALGAQCVMTTGAQGILKWSADSWDLTLVTIIIFTNMCCYVLLAYTEIKNDVSQRP